MYTLKQFRARFRMRRKLFNRIVRNLNDTYPYFQQNIDDVGRCGISALVKCTFTIRRLACDFVPDSLDEYLQIGTKTACDCLVNFYNVIMELYDEEYLRKPTQTDIEKLYAYREEKHGFPDMVESIDYTKWLLAQCPVRLRGQFCRGDS
ncbi:ALP1-like protein [Tanacetum coccineum]